MMDTSWNTSIEGTYQKELILPNILRLVALKRGEVVLDLACGQGFFSYEFAHHGAHVIGVDASTKLVALARRGEGNAKKIVGSAEFRVAKAQSLPFIKNKTIDVITIILALQNMDQVHDVLEECSRVLKPKGTLHVVLNHPAFRIPHASDWGWDERQKIQYRRIDQYLSESKVKIQMHPGDKPKDHTWSFHRPLQFYMKALGKAGFVMTALEEWNSHRKSQAGPRGAAEDKARKEIPLFLYFAAKPKNGSR